MKSDEHNLLQRIVQGDSQVFRELFDVYYDKIYVFALGFLKSKDDANDLTQEVFIKIWNGRGRFAEVRNLDTYIFVMTKNAIYDFLETRYANVCFDSVDSIEQVDDTKPVDLLIEKELQRMIDLTVGKMPVQRKRIYQMSRMEGLTNHEIAEKLNLSQKTIEYHLSLALKELRNVISMAIMLYLC